MRRFPDFSAPAPARRHIADPAECRAPADLAKRMADAIPPTGPGGRHILTPDALHSLLAAAIETGASMGLGMKEMTR